MSKKLYYQDEQGGITFHTERKIGDVRIPNYIYDLYLPLLGATAIGVYAMYCRLEREGKVQGMNQNKIARACRIGNNTLAEINSALETCRFIRIEKPIGDEKLKHYTSRIITLDPPLYIIPEIIEQYSASFGYEILCPWLLTDDNSLALPVSNADDTNEKCVTLPASNAKIEALNLQPLINEVAPPENRQSEKPDFVDLLLSEASSPDVIARKEMRVRFKKAIGLTPNWDSQVKHANWSGLETFLLAEDRAGRTPEKWAAWYKADEFRAKLIPHLTPEKIRTAWGLAFEEILITVYEQNNHPVPMGV
jgi:hypothetical protein